jgi:lipopolysaccharide export system protein LptA
MRRVVCLGGLLLSAAMAAAPAALAQGIDMSNGGPVQVTAQDGFEWRESDQEVIASGDARAVRGNVTVLADRLIAHYRKKAGVATSAGAAAAPAATPVAASADGALGDADNGSTEVYRLEADGHVRIVTPTDEAVGDHAIYDIDQAVLVLTGHALKLTTPQDVMTARDSLEYWSQKHMAVARGHAVVVTNDAKRLSADTLVGYTNPNPNPNPNPAAPGATPPPPVKPGADPLAASAGKLQRVEAYGNVEVRTIADTVRGDRGLYFPDTGLARVFGHVRITHGQNQINGPAADINMKTGIAHMVSLANNRVQGIIMPNDASATANGAKPVAAH